MFLYIFYGVFGLLGGWMFAYWYEKIMPKITKKQSLIILGYKLHHSLYGILFILLAFFASRFTSQIFFISFGLGIIIQHCLSSKSFDFITKEKRTK